MKTKTGAAIRTVVLALVTALAKRVIVDVATIVEEMEGVVEMAAVIVVEMAAVIVVEMAAVIVAEMAPVIIVGMAAVIVAEMAPVIVAVIVEVAMVLTAVVLTVQELTAQAAEPLEKYEVFNLTDKSKSCIPD